MLRVEFVGIPGTGKTTLQKKVVSLLQTEKGKSYLTMEEAFYYVAQKKIDKAYRYVLRFFPSIIGRIISKKMMNRSLAQFEAQNRFISKWGKSFEVFLSSTEYHNLSITDRVNVITAFLQIGSNYEFTNNEFPNDTVIFFEEGFIQKSFMFISFLTEIGSDKTNVFDYLNNIPLPDIVINVKTDLGTCYERIVSRKHGLTERLKNCDKETIMKFLSVSNEHFEQVINWLKCNSDRKIMHIRNNGEIDYVIDSLYTSLLDSIDIRKKFNT